MLWKRIISLNIFSTPRHGSDELSIYDNDQGRDYQSCKFQVPWAKYSCARARPYVILVNMRYLIIYKYTTLWLLLFFLLYMLCSSVFVDFYLFYDGTLDMQISALLKKRIPRWPLMPVSLLLNIAVIFFPSVFCV